MEHRREQQVVAAGAAEEKLRAGDLDAALAALQADIRRSPADPRLRVFLAELLMVRGEWERSHAQLGVAGELDALALPMVQLYRFAIESEAARAQVFAGKRSPVILGEPASWMASLVQAVGLDAAGEAGAAAQLRAEAFEAAPAVGGTLNGAPFEWLADADSRLGPMLEAVIDGTYHWVPFERIRQVRIEAPADLRDLVWALASFTWVNGGQTPGLIPVRYPGTERCEDGRLRLARRTEWGETGAGSATGLGQRVLTTDADESGLLDVRELDFAMCA